MVDYRRFVILCLYLIIENIIHNISIKSIPIRIHVNGTRGKSSVARLIAAGVRAGGYTTVAKLQELWQGISMLMAQRHQF